ncbi:hypothetical protein Tco_0857548 [Tanacetum coccineum]|uniref:Uncharacterized protein n=1 Tax=Tanacetum coccineum TaxID=301880 RepID=A0ABQ5B6I5_9ASTR
MGEKNLRRTLGDYSRPSHEGYRNTIEVLNGNDLAPLRSDTIREQLGDASIEIQAYTQALKKVEAQLVSHQKNQLCQLSANDKAGFGHNGLKESKVSETITSVSKVETSNSETSNDKVEMPKIKTVRMSEPIIEEWESDSEDDEIMVKPKEVTKTFKPSFEKIESVNARNETVRQVENPRKNNKSPRGNKRNWNGMMTHKLELAIPEQTATGKESSNSFMDGSLPKTIHLCDSLQSDEDSFELIELMILCTNFLTMGRIDDADAEVTFIDETSKDARNKNNKISNSN